MVRKHTSWELSAGIFPGLLLGIRSYEDGEFQNRPCIIPWDF